MGEQGILAYGPYVTMNKGKYRLLVYGTVATAKESWVDVVSRRGRQNHGKWSLVHQEAGKSRILLNRSVVLKEKAQNLEVRFFVGQNDELSIRGYKLKPVTH